MTVCKAKGREQGAWFEIKCVKETIQGKESRSEDASFERSLLRSWAKYPGYEGAKAALASLGKPYHHS